MFEISWGSGAQPLLRLTFLAMLATSIPAVAGDETQPPHGTLEAAIRSAGLPCQHVISVAQAGDGRWSVRCNSGSYLVVRDDDGQLSVR